MPMAITYIVKFLIDSMLYIYPKTKGRRAEVCLTSREPHEPPDLNDPVNEYRQYRCIMRSNLGKLKLVLGCEIDAVDANSQLPRPQNFVEIKTQRIITDQRAGENFRRNKLYKWWAQSFLGSVPRILVAFRNDKVKDFK